MNQEQLEKALKQGGRIQITPPSGPPPKVVEIGLKYERAMFDLNDIVAIVENGTTGTTLVQLRHSVERVLVEIPYDKFKALIGARPQKLEVPDEDR
jgi:hypothetical protein